MRLLNRMLTISQYEIKLSPSESALTLCPVPIVLGAGRETTMDAKVVPGPGAKGDRAATSAASDRHSIQSVDRALLLLEAIAELGGEATLTELSHRTSSTSRPAITCSRRWSSATTSPRCRAAALRARRAHPVSRPRLPAAGRSAAPRAAAISRRINARPARPCISPCCRATRSSRCVKREARHAVRVDTGTLGRIDAPHAHRDRQGDARLAAGGRDPPHPARNGLKRFTDKDHHRISER